MAKPSRLPVWSTDTNLSSGPASGSPTKVEPSSGYKTQGFVPGNKFLSQYVNDVLNVNYQWAAYLDSGVWEDDIFLTGNMAITGHYAYLSPTTRTMMLNLAEAFTGGGYSGGTTSDWYMDQMVLKCSIDAGKLYLPIKLPRGCALVSVRAGVNASNNGPMYMLARYRIANLVTGANSALADLSPIQNSTGAGTQLMPASVCPSPVIINNTAQSNFVYIQAGATVGSGLGVDVVNWVQVTFDDYGLANG